MGRKLWSYAWAHADLVERMCAQQHEEKVICDDSLQRSTLFLCACSILKGDDVGSVAIFLAESMYVRFVIAVRSFEWLLRLQRSHY